MSSSVAILVVDKNPLPLIAPVHHVVNRSLKLDPKFPRHLETLSSFTAHINSQFDPFSFFLAPSLPFKHLRQWARASQSDPLW
jgi:hypothetical protein